MNENEFATGSVPVMVAARIYGKDASWVRAGIISGWLPIGKATRNGQLVTKIEDMNSKLSVVVPIDKLSILVTIAFSYIVFREKLTAKAGIGLVLIVAGTLLLLQST